MSYASLKSTSRLIRQLRRAALAVVAASALAGTARAVRRQNPKARGLVTIEYPKEKAPMPEHFRNIPFLVYDTE